MKKITSSKHWWLLLVILSTIGCKKQDTVLELKSESGRPAPKKEIHGFAEDDMVLYWNNKAATVLTVPMSQPARARYFAIIQIAVHDALNAIKPKFERFALLDERSQFALPDAAIATAAYWAIKGLGRQGNFPIDQWLNESLANLPDGESKNLGLALGKKAADAVVMNRANDGFTQVIASAALPVDGINPGSYRSTLPYSNPALNLAHLKTVVNWGAVMKPFVIQTNHQFRPAGPFDISSPEYAIDYNESKNKGAAVNSTRTDAEERLAKFWAEIRSSLIWNNLVRKVITTKKMDAWKTARLLALVHTAAADGTNAGLEAKYHFYSWRPETAIRSGAKDGNPATMGDAAWLPAVIALANANPLLNVYTPTVPEYPSSFSIFAGAFSGVLNAVLGADEISVDIESPTLPGIMLHYSSISQASTDNTLAMIYTGWYFRKAVIDGQEQGKQIANYVVNHAFREIE